MVDHSEIAYRVADHVATIELARPEARNGYTIAMADELADAFARADNDDDVRAVVFTGQGGDFCVGADLSSGGFDFDTATGPADDWQEPAGRCSKRIFTMNKPVIAAIRGAAVGAGSTVILPCDFRLAATDTRFGYVFVRRGIYPEGGSSWFLPKLVGLAKAMDWMLTGRVFGAEEAHEAGLVHSLHEPDAVLDAAYALAADLVANTAPVAVGVTRRLVYAMASTDSPAAAHELDSKLIARIATDPDAIEGVMSFLEKRAPRFPQRVSTDLPDFLPWSR